MKKPSRSELRRAIELSLELVASPVEGATLFVRALEAVATPRGPVLVGRDAHQQPHLLLAVDASEDEPNTAQSAAINACRRPLVHDGQQHVFVDVVCRVPRLNRLFGLLCTDLLDRIVERPDAPEAVVTATLNDWRALVANAETRLSEPKARGLFGELHELHRLLDIDSTAVACWRGPEGAEHDFTGGSRSIEVKAKARQGDLVEIHGIQQLAAPKGGSLLLVVQTIESRTSGTSLATLVETVAEQASEPELFLDRLSLLGLTPSDAVLAEYSFEVLDERVFLVGEGFPRLVRDDLLGGHLHPGIRRIEYVIDLSSSGTPLDATAIHDHRSRMVAR